MSAALDEKALRKAWLKRKFASFDYHEELLQLHRGFVAVMRRALDRALRDKSPDPGYGTKAAFAENFAKQDWKVILGNDDAGKYKREDWPRYRATATFRAIPDYNRYLLSEGDRLGWMTDDERTELSRYWGPLSRMAQSIAYTVDDRWDEDPEDCDWILDPKYTGPITWPSNWLDEVADIAGAPTLNLSAAAGQPCPATGYWVTAARADSRSHFQQGETMPDVGGDYGTTIWQWDERQD